MALSGVIGIDEDSKGTEVTVRAAMNQNKSVEENSEQSASKVDIETAQSGASEGLSINLQGSLDFKGEEALHADLSKKKSGGKTTVAKTIGTAAAVGLGTATGALPAALLIAGGVGVLSRSSSSEGKVSPTSKPGSPFASQSQFSGFNNIGKQNNAVEVDMKKEHMTVQVQLDQDKSKTEAAKIEQKKTENDKNQEIEVVREAVDDDNEADETNEEEKVQKLLIQRRGQTADQEGVTHSELTKQQSEEKNQIVRDSPGKRLALVVINDGTSFSMKEEVTVVRQEIARHAPEYERSQSKTERVKKRLGGLDKKVKDSRLKQECKDIGREIGSLASETKRGGVDRLLKRNKH